MDTNTSSDGAQGGAEGLTLDIDAILAGSSLMRMINEGYVSKESLNAPIRLVGLGDMQALPVLNAA